MSKIPSIIFLEVKEDPFLLLFPPLTKIMGSNPIHIRLGYTNCFLITFYKLSLVFQYAHIANFLKFEAPTKVYYSFNLNCVSSFETEQP